MPPSNIRLLQNSSENAKGATEWHSPSINSSSTEPIEMQLPTSCLVFFKHHNAKVNFIFERQSTTMLIAQEGVLT